MHTRSARGSAAMRSQRFATTVLFWAAGVGDAALCAPAPNSHCHLLRWFSLVGFRWLLRDQKWFQMTADSDCDHIPLVLSIAPNCDTDMCIYIEPAICAAFDALRLPVLCAQAVPICAARLTALRFALHTLPLLQCACVRGRLRRHPRPERARGGGGGAKQAQREDESSIDNAANPFTFRHTVTKSLGVTTSKPVSAIVQSLFRGIQGWTGACACKSATHALAIAACSLAADPPPSISPLFTFAQGTVLLCSPNPPFSPHFPFSERRLCAAFFVGLGLPLDPAQPSTAPLPAFFCARLFSKVFCLSNKKLPLLLPLLFSCRQPINHLQHLPSERRHHR